MAPKHVDVIVIGAGLSGLSAASTLHSAGLSMLILEARDRVGGKTWSVDFAGGISDMGAAWINDTNQSHMYALAQKFNLSLIEQNTTGSIIMHDIDKSVHTFPYGSVPSQEAEEGGVANMIMIRDLFESLCHKIDIRDPVGSGKKLGVDYDGMSMRDFATKNGGGKTAMGTITIWTRAMLGLEPGEVSALFFLCYCESGGGIMRMRSDRKDGGQFLRIATGTQSFSHGFVKTLPPGSLILNSPVKSITSSQGKTTVSTATTEYNCSRVIVSLPTTLYKTITFTPPLPPAKLKLSEGTVHGHTSKVVLAYKSPWWKSSDLCGLTQSPNGLVTVSRDVSNPAANHHALLCFIEGDISRAWSRQSETDRKAAVLAHIKEVFAPIVKDVPEPIDIVEQIWSNEEFSMGCPCPAMPPGLMSSVGEALRTPAGSVHFVGTETAVEWRGYMEGAVRSGERGAKEVVAALRKAKL